MKIASCGSLTDCPWVPTDWVSQRQRRSLRWWWCRCLSLVNRGTHLRLHGTYQTSHGRPHCPILKSVLLSNTGPNNSEQFWNWSNTATANNPGWVIGTATVIAAVSHIVSVMEYLVHVYRSYPSLATGTNLRTWTRLGSLACVDVFRVNYYLVFRWSQNKYSPK